MGIEENKAVVRRQFELLNQGDTEGAAASWAAESFNHGRKADPARLAQVYASLHTVLERHDLHEMIAEGDWVAVRTTCHGEFAGRPELPVNDGIFSGIEPSGRTYSVQHIHLFRIAGGKLTEHWANRDDLGAARQIGRELTPSSSAPMK